MENESLPALFVKNQSLIALNKNKVNTDTIGEIKEVCNEIVTSSLNVVLSPNAAYLFVSWQNVNGDGVAPVLMLLLTQEKTISQVTIYGSSSNIWKMLPTSGLTQGIYAKDGFYNYAKIVRL